MFYYDRPLLDRFATIRAGVGYAPTVDNTRASSELDAEYLSRQRHALERIGDTPLSEIPSIAAWRRVFSGFGVKPTQYRSAAEALLRRLTKKGDIPSINPLVDIANMVSITYALPVAFFDLDGIEGATRVTFAEGRETFTDLGSNDVASPEPGEVIFVDEANVVSARRWCWRQSAESATSPRTTRVLVTVEGHHSEAAADVAAAIEDISISLQSHGFGELETTGLLSPDTPGFSAES